MVERVKLIKRVRLEKKPTVKNKKLRDAPHVLRLIDDRMAEIRINSMKADFAIRQIKGYATFSRVTEEFGIYEDLLVVIEKAEKLKRQLYP